MQLLISWFSIICISLLCVCTRWKSLKLFSKHPCLWLSWLSLPAAFLILLHLSLEMGGPRLHTVLNTQVHQGFGWWIRVTFFTLFTVPFIIFPKIQLWIFLSGSEHKSDISIKLSILMARSHFQVAIVNSELSTVYRKLRLGFFPPRASLQIYLSWISSVILLPSLHVIRVFCNSHSALLSLVPWII